MLLYEMMKDSTSSHPNRTAIIYRDAPITYTDLYNNVNRLAHALKARGINRGDRVSVLLPNSPQFTIAYYAITSLGAICVPINPLLKPAELAYIWGNCQCSAVITGPSLLQHTYEARESVPSIRLVATIGAKEERYSDLITFSDLLQEGQQSEIDTSALTENDPAVCIYTSGTTGRPKGALLSHHNLTVNALQVTKALEFTADDNFLTVLPLFHAFGATICQNMVVMLGATSTILDMFHPAHVVSTVLNHKVTVMPAVPAMYSALVQFASSGNIDLSGVRICISGGAAIPVPLIHAFEARFNTSIYEGYGPTECSPVTSVNPANSSRRLGSIGPSLPTIQVKIFDENDNEKPTGEVGEIVVRGENVMLGYYNNPEATAEAMRSGWYHTGDMGRVDEDAYIYIVDRKKDMLIVGGLNVYPREVEEVLYTHNAVADAAVVGAPDPLRGEEVVAVIVLKPEGQATSREIISYCRARLANYKVPRRVVFKDALPRSATGKILKRVIRDEMNPSPKQAE